MTELDSQDALIEIACEGWKKRKKNKGKWNMRRRRKNFQLKTLLVETRWMRDEAFTRYFEYSNRQFFFFAKNKPKVKEIGFQRKKTRPKKQPGKLNFP